MKKILFTALVTFSIITSAFAQDEKKISYKVLQAFTTEFNEATDVSWMSKSNFDKASFNLDGKQLSAFYNTAGEKIGVTQEVSFATLPSGAKKWIAKKYNDYSIKATILFESDRETAYFVLAENNFQSVVLEIRDGCVLVFKKTIKSPSIDSNSLQMAVFN